MEWDSMLSERATRKVIQSQNKKKKLLHVTLSLPEVINNKIDIVLAVVYNFSSYLTYLLTKI